MTFLWKKNIKGRKLRVKILFRKTKFQSKIIISHGYNRILLRIEYLVFEYIQESNGPISCSFNYETRELRNTVVGNVQSSIMWQFA